MVEDILDSPHVPNDVSFSGVGQGRQTMILTGLNMGGKSTFSRMVGILILLAQIGSWVPAETCTLSIFDGIYSQVADSVS